MNRPEPQLSKTALEQLATYHWPGNVRELQNTVERAIILWREGPLTFDLPASPARQDTGLPAKASGKPALVTRDELKGCVGVAPRLRQSGKKRFFSGSPLIPLGNARLRKAL